MVVMISDGPRLMIDQLGEQTKVTEAVTVMVRRYGTPKVELPLVGDLLVLNDAGVEKRYKLNVMPASAFSHLEWKLEFSRTMTKSRGGLRSFLTEVKAWGRRFDSVAICETCWQAQMSGQTGRGSLRWQNVKVASAGRITRARINSGNRAACGASQRTQRIPGGGDATGFRASGELLLLCFDEVNTENANQEEDDRFGGLFTDLIDELVTLPALASWQSSQKISRVTFPEVPWRRTNLNTEDDLDVGQDDEDLFRGAVWMGRCLSAGECCLIDGGGHGNSEDSAQRARHHGGMTNGRRTCRFERGGRL